MSSQNIRINGSSHFTVGDISQSVGGSHEKDGGPTSSSVRILFLAANPEGTSRLRLDHEARAISDGLRASRLADRFEFEQGWVIGERELQDYLLRHDPDIVHLSGHGKPGGELLLEQGAHRDLGSHRPATPLQERGGQLDGLVQIFAAARGRIRCVVLNACHSEPSAGALAQVVGCVVGMSSSIADEAAIRFSWSFYNALGHGLSIQAAFDLAKGQIALGGWRMAEIPRLVSAGVDPAGILFS
jgi:hypothetical protein